GNKTLRKVLFGRSYSRKGRTIQTFLPCHRQGSVSRESHAPCYQEHDRRPPSHRELFIMLQPSFVRPPRIAAWLVDLFTPERQIEAIQGDLLEEFSDLVSRSGAASARRWF